MRSNMKSRQMRDLIAQEAARLIVEEGLRDYYAAKRKAALRVGAPGTRNMPRNTEVEAALQSYQKLFYGDRQTARLRELRSEALEAMRFFKQFEPRLVGSVLTGTAGPFSDINLHLFTDVPEDVTLYLLENHVPFETEQRRLRISRSRATDYPLLRFMAGDYAIEAIVFPLDGMRQAPFSPTDGRPMRRAAIDNVTRLLESTD